LTTLSLEFQETNSGDGRLLLDKVKDNVHMADFFLNCSS